MPTREATATARTTTRTTRRSGTNQQCPGTTIRHGAGRSFLPTQLGARPGTGKNRRTRLRRPTTSPRRNRRQDRRYRQNQSQRQRTPPRLHHIPLYPRREDGQLRIRQRGDGGLQAMSLNPRQGGGGNAPQEIGELTAPARQAPRGRVRGDEIKRGPRPLPEEENDETMGRTEPDGNNNFPSVKNNYTNTCGSPLRKCVAV